MNSRRISMSLVLAVAGLGTLFHLATLSSGNTGSQESQGQVSALTVWEYAQLEYHGTLRKKGSHHAWQWISSEEGVVIFQGRSEIATIRDLCHKISETPVDFKSSQARDTHIILLDTIGKKGWEMVDHSQEIKDLELDPGSSSSGKPSVTASITWRWSFKRPR